MSITEGKAMIAAEVPRHIDDRITYLAKLAGTSKSHIIRKALTERFSAVELPLIGLKKGAEPMDAGEIEE